MDGMSTGAAETVAVPRQLALIHQAPADIIAGSCPDDPSVLLEEAVWAATRGMKPRANQTRHLDGCRNARVNSQWFDCSDDCERAQIAVARGRVWLEKRRATAPELARREAL